MIFYKKIAYLCIGVHFTLMMYHNVIYLDWFAPDLYNDKLFELVDGGKEWQLLKKKLEHKKITLTTRRYKKNPDSIYYMTSFDMPADRDRFIQRFNKAKIAIFLWEPPSVKPHNFNLLLHHDIPTIFTWADALVDEKKYFKFFYPQPQEIDIKHVPYEDKKFCCAMVGNKQSNHPDELYSERLKTILFFEKHAPHLFDLYGPGWNGHRLSCYKGFVADKYEVLSRYKFCICYENIKNITGYISEKIHHCLLSGTVPIYWGASNITDYIPSDCFIDRRLFSSNDDVYAFLLTITKEQYQAYLDAAYAYLHSTQQLLFSNFYFAHCLLKGFISEYNRYDFFTDSESDLLWKLDMMQHDIIKKAVNT